MKPIDNRVDQKAHFFNKTHCLNTIVSFHLACLNSLTSWSL